MNKIITIFTGIAMLSGLAAFAQYGYPEDILSGVTKGIYTCPTNESRYCIFEYDETGMSKINCPNDTKLLNIIKSGVCTFQPPKTERYSCQYEQGSCKVILKGQSDHYVTCTGTTPAIEQVITEARSGKCYKD